MIWYLFCRQPFAGWRYLNDSVQELAECIKQLLDICERAVTRTLDIENDYRTMRAELQSNIRNPLSCIKTSCFLIQFTYRKGKYPIWKAPGVSSNYGKGSGGYRECIKITDNWRSTGRGIFVQYFFLEWEKLNLQIKRRHTHEVCFSRI